MTVPEAFPLRLLGDGGHTGSVCTIVLVRATPVQFHLGLGRGSAPPEPVLHLAWHRRLRDQPCSEVTQGPDGKALPSAVIALSLDPLIDQSLQILARRVARHHANRLGEIAYGFGETSATFRGATAQLSEPEAAFTCATFVLAMLRSVGVQMIDPTRWRDPTEEDLRWQREIAKTLLDWMERWLHGDLPRAKERVERDIGSRRHRPTDVAGAALFGPAAWPVGVEEVEPRAATLESKLSWTGPPD